MDNKRTNRSTKKIFPILTAAELLLLAVVLVLIFKQKALNETNTMTGTSAGTNLTAGKGESIVIPIAELSDQVSFYSADVEGTTMEIMAVKDADGTVRTAFNTCQVCYNSGRGYYVLEGNDLICQNCGSRFTAADIQTENGGCNPYPIFDEDKVITDSTVEIPYDFLVESKNIFAAWHKPY